MKIQTIHQLQQQDITNQTRLQFEQIPNRQLTNNSGFLVNYSVIITLLSILLIFIVGTIIYPIAIHYFSHFFSLSMTHSHHQLRGLPLFSIGIVPMGIISIGIVPMGIISIGIVPMGLISLGTVAMGLLSIGLVSMGAICSGSETMGLLKYKNFLLTKIWSQFTQK